MLTFQDYEERVHTEADKMKFIEALIGEYKASERYKTAVIADEYARQENTTITQYQKLLYTMAGEAVPDNYSANYKLASGFFDRFISQRTQYLLSNGITFNKPGTKKKLGKKFDKRMQTAGYEALSGGVSYIFWNYDHIEVFTAREFAPLYDEETGEMMAGVRFWRLDTDKPLRATFYEQDGYTDYIWRTRKERTEGEIFKEKRAYIQTIARTPADGEEIIAGENYSALPIVTLYPDDHKQSKLVGLRENIDAYDLIKSGFANDLDDASQIYWVISNAGGMGEIDLKEFLDRMKRVKASMIDEEGAKAEAHTIEVPYNSREAILTRLRSDMYEDFGALDTKNIAAGAVTATQVMAAYEPMDNKTDPFETHITDAIEEILELAGIEDEPSFTRSVIINRQEEIQTVIQAAEYTSEDYTTTKILTLMGDADQIATVKAEKEAEDIDRFSGEDDGELEDFGNEIIGQLEGLLTEED